MGDIQVLDKITIDKIAAGEVVERPASVVKELVENAIDAGATAVVVESQEGGISSLILTDNGCGIAKEDIPNAFLRHSTSKIRQVEDLFIFISLDSGRGAFKYFGCFAGGIKYKATGRSLWELLSH